MKRHGLKALLAVAAICIPLASAGAVRAEGGMRGGPGMEKGRHECGHGRSWKDTLTDAQRSELGRMRLDMKKKMSVLRAELGVKKAELKALILRDDPDMRAVGRKADEVLSVRKEMMKNRISGVIDVRKVLTPAQRVSFDSMVMSGPEGWWHGRGDRD